MQTWLLSSWDDVLSSSKLVPLAVLVVTVYLVMRWSRGVNRPASSPPPRPAPAPLTTQERMRRDLESLMVELQELSRRISAEIDTRFAKLEAAMRDADRRIAALQRTGRKVRGAAGTGEGVALESEDRHAVVYELADAGVEPLDIARRLGRTPGEIELILKLRARGASESASSKKKESQAGAESPSAAAGGSGAAAAPQEGRPGEPPVL